MLFSLDVSRNTGYGTRHFFFFFYTFATLTAQCTVVHVVYVDTLTWQLNTRRIFWWVCPSSWRSIYSFLPTTFWRCNRLCITLNNDVGHAATANSIFFSGLRAKCPNLKTANIFSYTVFVPLCIYMYIIFHYHVRKGQWPYTSPFLLKCLWRWQC